MHTRSLKYGKLGQGCLVRCGILHWFPDLRYYSFHARVSPSLVKRRKTHFHQLPIGASIILGNNGLVWLHPSREEEGGGENSTNQKSENKLTFLGGGGWAADLGVVSLQEREVFLDLFSS